MTDTSRTEAAGALAPPPEGNAGPTRLERMTEWFARVAGRSPRVLYFAWAVVAIAWAGSFALVWVCVLMGREMWDWAGPSLLRDAGAVVGSVILVFVPVWGWM